MNTERAAEWVLRIGVAFAFLYPPLDAIRDPYAWIGYFPGFVHGYVPDLVLLHAFGALEIVIALWILSGWRIYIPSAIAAAILLAIVVFDYSDFQVLFRDVAIAAASLSVALSAWARKTRMEAR